MLRLGLGRALGITLGLRRKTDMTPISHCCNPAVKHGLASCQVPGKRICNRRTAQLLVRDVDIAILMADLLLTKADSHGFLRQNHWMDTPGHADCYRQCRKVGACTCVAAARPEYAAVANQGEIGL